MPEGKYPDLLGIPPRSRRKGRCLLLSSGLSPPVPAGAFRHGAGVPPGPSLLQPGPGAVGQISWLIASGSRRRGANVLLAPGGVPRAAFGPGTPCSGPARRVLWRGSGLLDGRRQCYGHQSCPEHLAEHGGGTCVSLFHPTLLSRACSAAVRVIWSIGSAVGFLVCLTP